MSHKIEFMMPNSSRR